MYVIVSPTFAVAVAVFVASRSAVGSTVTDAESLSFRLFGSNVVVDTVAVLTFVPVLVAVTVMCSVVGSSGTIVPSAQVTVPADSVHGASAETKLVPAGSGSLTDTLAASLTPLFLTTSV